jgi:hypothetical protein
LDAFPEVTVCCLEDCLISVDVALSTVCIKWSEERQSIKAGPHCVCSIGVDGGESPCDRQIMWIIGVAF